MSAFSLLLMPVAPLSRPAAVMDTRSAPMNCSWMKVPCVISLAPVNVPARPSPLAPVRFCLAYRGEGVAPVALKVYPAARTVLEPAV